MCPHTCVTNLPKPREIHSDIGPASVMVGNIVQGNRLATAQGRDLGVVDEESDSAKKVRVRLLANSCYFTREYPWNLIFIMVS